MWRTANRPVPARGARQALRSIGAFRSAGLTIYDNDVVSQSRVARRPAEGPHWVEVDGLVLPRPVGGHPVLDFVNPAIWEGAVASEGADYLQGYDHLAVWAREAGLLAARDVRALQRRAATRRHVAEQVVTDARRFRTELRAALLAPGRRAALDPFNRRLAHVAPLVRVTPVVDPALAPAMGLAPALGWEVGGGLERPLSVIVWAAALLLTEIDPGTVRVCPGHDCGWLFLDASGRRRWCSMRSCGNRAKVAAHAARMRG